MPLTAWRRQRNDRTARVPAAAVVSHGSLAQSAAGIFLSRHDGRLRRDARVFAADRAARPLVHRCLYSRAAVEPECEQGRRCRTSCPIASAADGRAWFRRYVAGPATAVRRRTGAEMTAPRTDAREFMAPAIANTVLQRSLGVGLLF